MIGKEILNYTIVSFIGKGGMGSVYLAEHKYIKQQKVAIKVINKDMVNGYTLKLLKEEAEHLASLNHQNIVHFLDYHLDEAGNIYLIMEYADGVSLDKYIRDVSGLIVEERICPLFEPILDAVGYAHKHSIVHRDIKPANIMITQEGTPKILDFGIAKLINQNASEQEDMIIGTPSYMSPEQVRGEELDGRSDIYSLGVLLHQMLTGNAPYDTTTLTEYDINKKVVEEPLPRLRTYYKYVSDKMQKVVDKATAKRAEDRYQTCADFKKALHQAIYPPKVSKWVWSSVAALVLILVVGGVWIWDYNRTKVSYYKDYVEQWGVPQGIGELSLGDVKRIHRCYRFEYRKYKLQRMSHVNSKGYIIEDGESERNERPLDMLLFYRDNGKISSAKILDRNGKVLYVKVYNDKLNTVVFQYNDEYGTEKTLAAQTIGYVHAFNDDSVEKGRISRWLLEYDANGYVTTIRYAGFQNVLVGDAHNIYGRSYIRDEKGRVSEEHYLAYDGSPKATKWGLGIKKFYYDREDNWVKTDYLTVDGRPAYDDVDGVSVYVMEYDKYGNVVYALHQDARGELMLPKKYGIAGIKSVYDANGFPVETSYLDTDKKICYMPGKNYCKVIDRFDDKGYIINKSFYDIDGNSCLSDEGMASVDYVNDNKGNNLEIWFYGVDKELYETSEGNAGAKMKYDSVGNIVEYITYGKDQKVCLVSDGTAGYKVEYNDRNLITKLSWIGTNLLPCENENGISIMKYDYDKRGNQIKVMFYDTTGTKLILSNEGIAGWNSVYDENGNEIERNFFDEKEKPCLVSGNYAKWISKFDERGNEISERFYDLKGNLILYEGRVGTDYIRDERGNILENKPIGSDGNLAKGMLVARYKYDKFDNVTEFVVFEDGRPAINAYGYHKYTCKYNNRNQQIEIRYYDKDGKLTLYGGDKYAVQKDEYDDKGNNIKTFYYDKNDRLVVCNEGWASSTRDFDALGRVIKQSFFDIKGNPTDPAVMVPEGFCKYDKWGNLVYLASCDGKGNLVMNPQTGWSIKRSEYNIQGKVISESFFNERDKPMIYKSEGCHKMTYEYNKRGEKTVTAYFGTDNAPILVNGYHRDVYTYNEKGQWIENALYGKKGEKVNCTGGFHKILPTYDKEGNQVLRKYYRADGSLVGSTKWNGSEWVNVNHVSSGWQQDVRDSNSQLPLDLGENAGHLVIISFQVTGGNSCKMTFKTPKSKYEMAASELSKYSEQVKTLVVKFKSENLPSDVMLVGVLNDNKGRSLYTYKR